MFHDEDSPGTGDDLIMISMDAPTVPVWELNGAYNELSAALSPNGRWMAYQSDESGAFQIYVRPFPQVDGDLVPVSSDGGIMPGWSRDGSELFYLQPGIPPQLISVSYLETVGTFVVVNRQRLLDWPYRQLADIRTYDVSVDGRFLAVKPDADAAQPEIVVVVNWHDELTRRVPVD